MNETEETKEEYYTDDILIDHNRFHLPLVMVTDINDSHDEIEPISLDGRSSVEKEGELFPPRTFKFKELNSKSAQDAKRKEKNFSANISERQSENISPKELQRMGTLKEKKIEFVNRSVGNEWLNIPAYTAKAIQNVGSPKKGPKIYPLIIPSNKKRVVQNKDLLMIKEESTAIKLPIINTFTKVVRAISVLRKRAGLSCLSEHQVKIINDWSWFESKVIGRKRNTNRRNSLGEKIFSAGKKTMSFFTVFLQKLILGLNCCIVPLLEKINKIQVIHPRHKSKILWDILIMGLIFWNFITISLSLGFGIPLSVGFVFHESRTEETSTGFTSFVFLLFILLLFDIALTLNTSFYEAGELVTARRKIMKNYIMSNFILDLFALIPLYIEILLINEDSANQSYGSTKFVLLLFYLKYYNLKKVFDTIQELFTFNEGVEAIFSLFKLTIKIILIAHVIACIWHSIAYFSEYEKSWLLDLNILNSSWKKRYIISIYWSLTTMTTVGYGDVTAQNEIEMIFNIFTMLVGSAMFGYSINSIGSILDKMNFKENQLKYDLRILNRFMKRKNIDYDLQVRVIKYMEYVWHEEKSVNIQKEEELVKKLSSQLRDEVLLQSNGRFLNDCKVLSKNFSQRVIKELTKSMKQIRFSPEEIIFNEGDLDEDQNLYIVIKGEVELTVDSFRRGEKPTVIKKLKDGEVFGELAFFIEQPLDYTAKSVNFSTICMISKSEFLRILKENEDDYETFCMIRDEIIVYQNYKSLFQKCYSCNYSSHPLKYCPSLRALPNREFIISRYKKRKQNVRKIMFQERRPLEKHLRRISQNTLMESKKIQRAAERIQLEHLYEDSNIKDESSKENINVRKENKGEERKIIIQKPRGIFIGSTSQGFNINISRPRSKTDIFEEFKLEERNGKENSKHSHSKLITSASKDSISIFERSEINDERRPKVNETSFDLGRTLSVGLKNTSVKGMMNLIKSPEPILLKLKPPGQNMIFEITREETKSDSGIQNNNRKPSLLLRRSSFTPEEKLSGAYSFKEFNEHKQLAVNPKNSVDNPIASFPAKEIPLLSSYDQNQYHLSPTKITWKTKVNNFQSPLLKNSKNKPPPNSGLNQKKESKQDINSTTKLKTSTKFNNIPDKPSSGNVVSTESLASFPKKRGEKFEELMLISKPLPNEQQNFFSNENIIDMMDTCKNFFKYFQHNNPDLILAKINSKISQTEKTRLARTSRMKNTKKSKSILIPRRTINLIKSRTAVLNSKMQLSNDNSVSMAASNLKPE